MTTHYLIADAWPLVLCLALALLEMTYLAWYHQRQAAELRGQRNLAIDAGKGAYARGHADGLAEGLRRGAGEAETAFRKADYQKGYQNGYTAAWIETLEVVSEADATRQHPTIAA